MTGIQIQVLLALRDAGQSAAASQALLQAGARLSVLCAATEAELLDQVFSTLKEQPPALLVLELDKDWSAVERVRAGFPAVRVIAMLSKPTPDAAFALSRLGADDLWALPLVDPALNASRAREVLQRVQKFPGPSMEFPNTGNGSPSSSPTEPGAAKDGGSAPPLMVGANPMMKEIRETIEKVAGTDITVLIRGESGVGKEVVARMLFERSRRRQKPFVKVNCAAIPHDLLESELFGYEAGAFTGAHRDKPGKFELANHGTLFLDEIAEMHPMLQAKLLHILQDGRFSRLGAKRDISVDVRILCATNKLLEQRVKEGLFREDLLYRINAVTLFLPPLRERRDEIPVLTQHLLQKFAAQYGRALLPFSKEVIAEMMAYEWPGNIRELENLCKRYVIVGGETQILRELAERNHAERAHGERNQAKTVAGPSAGAPEAVIPVEEPKGEPMAPLSLLEVGRRAAWEAERRIILEMLESTRWNRREAARRLQVSYKALLNKIKQMKLDDSDPDVG